MPLNMLHYVPGELSCCRQKSMTSEMQRNHDAFKKMLEEA